MNVATFLRLASCTAALAGCGGGGGGGDGPTTSLPQEDDFDKLLQAQGDLTQAQQQLSVLTLTTDTVIGSANYKGFIVYSEIGQSTSTGGLGLAAEVDIDVNLTNTRNSVSGSISNFIDTSGAAYDGTISLSSGQIDRTNTASNGYAISARLTGELTDPDGIDFTSEGGLDADFLGANHQMISGISFLDLNGDARSVALRGTLVAEDSE